MGGLQESIMVVGRTMWDFAMEMVQNPSLRLWMLVLLILLEIVFIIIAVLIHSGLLSLKISYGGIGLETGPPIYSLALIHQF